MMNTKEEYIEHIKDILKKGIEVINVHWPLDNNTCEDYRTIHEVVTSLKLKGEEVMVDGYCDTKDYRNPFLWSLNKISFQNIMIISLHLDTYYAYYQSIQEIKRELNEISYKQYLFK